LLGACWKIANPAFTDDEEGVPPALIERLLSPSLSLTPMSEVFNSNYPSIEHLRERARQRVPRFAFEYLEGGCFSNINLQRNTEEIRQVQLRPWYLRDYPGSDLKTELFGTTYDAPFGVSPIGLQGLVWPKATEIIAKAANKHNIPFTLSTVATASIETVAELTEGKAWFQLYHPAEDSLRDKLLDRARDAGFPVLVILADTPTFAYRPKEIRNGLSIPPRMSVRNVIQMLLHPTWSFSQLAAGAPEFKTMKPYLPKGLSMKHLGLFMNRTFSGRLNPAKISAIRERWKGKLVVKGVVTEEDAETALGLGVDGFIVSNHGGRQLDAGQSTIKPLTELAKKFGQRTTVMIDSGLRAGPDVACALASGAKFAFMGRSFMYGVAALGKDGGDHTMTMLKRQLKQVMEQVGCERVADLPKHLVSGPEA
jgi:L-lactate dehydrogenase (cytochrome)